MRRLARAVFPYVATAAGVIEADRILDVQTLGWVALAAVAACGAIGWVAQMARS